MKNISRILVYHFILWTMAACSSAPSVENETKEDGKAEEIVNFYKGADISWVTELESKGHKFYNTNGQQRECTALLKDYGINAIRLRVWVNPSAHNN